jgi:hypothetical protein
MVLYKEFIKIKNKYGECVLEKNGEGRVRGGQNFSGSLSLGIQKELKILKINIEIKYLNKRYSKFKLLMSVLNIYKNRVKMNKHISQNQKINNEINNEHKVPEVKAEPNNCVLVKFLFNNLKIVKLALFKK